MTYKHNLVNYKIVNYNKSHAKHRLVLPAVLAFASEHCKSLD